MTIVMSFRLYSLERCPRESSNVLTCTEGLSFYPLIKDPTKSWKKAVFSQYPRYGITLGNVERLKR